MDIGIVTVGVGTHVDRQLLSSITSYPSSTNMFIAPSVRDVTSLADPIKRIICSGKTRSCRFTVQAYYQNQHSYSIVFMHEVRLRWNIVFLCIQTAYCYRNDVCGIFVETTIYWHLAVSFFFSAILQFCSFLLTDG